MNISYEMKSVPYVMKNILYKIKNNKENGTFS